MGKESIVLCSLVGWADYEEDLNLKQSFKSMKLREFLKWMV